MRVGCPTEIKPQEFRVGLTPAAAQELVRAGHEVVVQAGAGTGAGFVDADYTRAGAGIVDTAAEVFETADLVVKVKEPQAVERKQLRAGQALFTYLHLAPDPDQDPRPAGQWRDRHCLRNRHGPRGRLAAFWRPCPKWRGVWPRKWAHGRCKRPMVGAVY